MKHQKYLIMRGGSIPGAGMIMASVLIAAISDTSSFNQQQDFSARPCLAPRHSLEEQS
jgi:hypothetical protein